MRYPKEVVLKDGSDAFIRPLEKGDEPQLLSFYEKIPESDRWYMRYDVLEPALMRRLISGMESGTVHSIVALSQEAIVAHASLHLREFGSTRHIGMLRIMVARQFRQKRLGTWMLLDLIQLALDRGLNDLRADFVVGVEDGAIEAAQKLDFFEKALLKDYIMDMDGRRRDLLIMVKRLHKGWGDF